MVLADDIQQCSGPLVLFCIEWWYVTSSRWVGWLRETSRHHICYTTGGVILNQNSDWTWSACLFDLMTSQIEQTQNSGPSHREGNEAYSRLAQNLSRKILSWQGFRVWGHFNSRYRRHVSTCMYTQVFSPWWSHSSSLCSKASGASASTSRGLSDWVLYIDPCGKAFQTWIYPSLQWISETNKNNQKTEAGIRSWLCTVLDVAISMNLVQ